MRNPKLIIPVRFKRSSQPGYNPAFNRYTNQVLITDDSFE